MALFKKKLKSPLSNYIQSTFGIKPKDLSLYELAFTHKSFDQNLPNNERLEFLGDSVINTVVAAYLFDKYPEDDEGFLTKLRSRIVSRENLNEIGTKIQLLEHVKYYKGNNQYKSLEGNVFEAAIGAIYVDQGFAKTKSTLYGKILDKVVDIDYLRETDTDYKSQLLIWSQKNGLKLEYRVTEVQSKVTKYLAKLYVDSDFVSEAIGRSKKEAEKLAARSAFKKLI